MLARLFAMEVAMKEVYTANYLAAFNAATADLDNLFEEAKQLRSRMEQIDSVINALKPLVSDSVVSPEMVPELNPTKQQIDAALGLVLV
jgi:CHASE3 domain sensor protein